MLLLSPLQWWLLQELINSLTHLSEVFSNSSFTSTLLFSWSWRPNNHSLLTLVYLRITLWRFVVAHLGHGSGVSLLLSLRVSLVCKRNCTQIYWLSHWGITYLLLFTLTWLLLLLNFLPTTLGMIKSWVLSIHGHWSNLKRFSSVETLLWLMLNSLVNSLWSWIIQEAFRSIDHHLITISWS